LNCPSCQKLLRVPDSAAGKKAKCPQCATIFVIPEPIRDAEEIGAEEISPPAPAAAPAQDDYSVRDEFDFLRGPEAAASPAGPAGEEARRPCAFCGEMIVATAAKCRFCGAIFDYTLQRAEEKKRKKKTSDEDNKLSPIDWLVCLFCMNIGCIVGIVYAVQGKPKGWKMVVINIAVQVAVGFIIGMLQNSGQPHPRGFR
jgi:phage FluMu protein Com